MFSFTKEDGTKIQISFPDDPDYNEQTSEESDEEDDYDEDEIEEHKNILRNIKNYLLVQKNKIHKLVNNLKNVFKKLIDKRVYSKQEFEKYKEQSSKYKEIKEYLEHTIHFDTKTNFQDVRQGEGAALLYRFPVSSELNVYMDEIDKKKLYNIVGIEIPDNPDKHYSTMN
jgi:hypothetical protein